MTSIPTVAHTLPDRLASVRRDLLAEYQAEHRHPWIVAYSGGKDSTLLLQLVWETVATCPPDSWTRPILVIGNDTLVESPLVIRHLRRSLAEIKTAAAQARLPIDTAITEPCVDQTFWVNVIGRGYIPPTRNFRWCTDRLKILPTTRLLERFTRKSGGVLLLVGTRRAESVTRRRAMDRRRAATGRLNPHSTVSGCMMYAPIADLSDNDVWITLIQRPPPWGDSHRSLITLYRNAGGGECPLVISKEQAPSCGSSSPRFGCWTCTVIEKDRSLRGLIDSGHGDTIKMEALFDFREWLLELREDPTNRLAVRRDGFVKERIDGSIVYGPFTMQVRQTILQRLKFLETRLNESLISPAEIDAIEDVWWRDRIRARARNSLLHSVFDHDTQDDATL